MCVCLNIKALSICRYKQYFCCRVASKMEKFHLFATDSAESTETFCFFGLTHVNSVPWIYHHMHKRSSRRSRVQVVSYHRYSNLQAWKLFEHLFRSIVSIFATTQALLMCTQFWDWSHRLKWMFAWRPKWAVRCLGGHHCPLTARRSWVWHQTTFAPWLPFVSSDFLPCSASSVTRWISSIKQAFFIHTREGSS